MTSAFFENKVVVVTGGSDGIGRALIDLLMPLGARVATCGRNHDKLYQLEVEYAGKPLHTMVADVKSPNDCRRFVETTMKVFGRIDILINNAGISMRGLMTDVEPEVIKEVMDINFFGAVYITKACLPHLINSKGTIVGISSIAGYRGLPGRSGYSASKFALQGWLEALKTELKEDGVHVMWIAPGFTASNIRQSALTETGKAQGDSPLNEAKLMTADECAFQILKAIEKKKRTLVLTFQGKQTIFLNKFFPKLTDYLVHRFYFKDGKLMK